jgi:hypothetical protein
MPPLARLRHNLRRSLCPHAIKTGQRIRQNKCDFNSYSTIFLYSWDHLSGHNTLVRAPSDYKREGTLDTRLSSNTQSRHSCLGNATLSQVDVGYYALVAQTTLDPRVFLRDCVFFHLSRQTSYPS